MIWIFFTLFLFALFFLTGSCSALRRLQKRESKKVFTSLDSLFFFRPFFLKIFPNHEYEGIFLSILITQNIARFFAVIMLAFGSVVAGLLNLSWPLVLLIILAQVFLLFMIGDFIPRLIGSRFPKKVLPIFLIIISPFLYLFFPITSIFVFMTEKLGSQFYFDLLNEPIGDVKHEIYEILQEAEIATKLTTHDRKLIESVFRFQTRIAREVMVPRIDIFSLNANVPIKQAAQLLHDEGYSRVPVYNETIDEIIGVLMYKDILTKYMEFQQTNDLKILEAAVETIVKPIMYTPETKKISNLLQEFRKKQSHLSIVVDEYGGTAGIITIEDILEEIVGEIEDEYDDDEEALYAPLHDGSWIVDARMTIIDAEEQFNIHIPNEGDYDTLGGYIFQRAGAIPSKGFNIKLDDVELEVLKSNDRRVEKIKIKVITPQEH